MIERGFEQLRKLPSKVEAAVGVCGIFIYGTATVVPAEVKELYEEVPISGQLINIMSEADLRIAGGALAIFFSILVLDGYRRIRREGQEARED